MYIYKIEEIKMDGIDRIDRQDRIDIYIYMYTQQQKRDFYPHNEQGVDGEGPDLPLVRVENRVGEEE